MIHAHPASYVEQRPRMCHWCYVYCGVALSCDRCALTDERCPQHLLAHALGIGFAEAAALIHEWGMAA